MGEEVDVGVVQIGNGGKRVIQAGSSQGTQQMREIEICVVESHW